MQINLRDILISLVIMAAILALGSRRRNGKLVSLNSFCILTFTFFCVIILSLTGVSPISGFDVKGFGEGANFIPFVGMIDMLKDGISRYAIVNILGNVLMFAPVGFFAPILYQKYNSLGKTALVGASISLLVEFSQMFLARGTDTDDVILNTLGAVLGYGLFKLYRLFFPKLSEKVALSTSRNTLATFWLCVAIPYLVIVACGFYDRAVYFGYL